jgi:gamma-glutamylcyclotransferase (GGCT)/AIG2-like uncharacterized protein YtfP
MIERLFVYGTLGPERPNEHILNVIGGSWSNATITGILRSEGWGAEMGYPGLVLDEQASEIEGFVYSSENFLLHWQRLDDFEGDGYSRVFTRVKLENGQHVDAYVYVLR